MRILSNIRNAVSLDAYRNLYENTWDKLADLAGKDILLRLYFVTGIEDHLYLRYLNFKAYAQSINLAATFEEGAGKHEWRFWDAFIQRALIFFGLTDQDAGNMY